MDTSPPRIGIDLGTTHSLCAHFHEGAPALIPNAHGATLTPSAVGVLESGEVIVGEAARELAVTQPERVALHFKRWMGEDREVELAGRTFRPVELSALVLRALKADAEAFLGTEVNEAVITVPAYFNETQRRNTREAGQLAGLEVRRIVNEPTAAALAHGLRNNSGDERLLVFDLGGGTFDVTVMEVFEGTLEILSSAGESRLGGEDFTQRIVAWALRKSDLEFERAEMLEPLRVARLRTEAEAAKRSLGSQEKVTVRLPNPDGNLPEDVVSHALSAAEFEELCEPLLASLRRPVQRALRDARLRPDQVARVLLVGGATRMPVVQSVVTELFGRPASTELDPDRVVALGAAVQAALIEGDEAVDDVVLTDVCPFTLGVEVVKDLGQGHADGYFNPVIHRNTTIPVSRQDIFSTIKDNQTQIRLKVYQGESRRVEDNLFLGELLVDQLPPAKAGLDVAVRFTYDLNGLLEVEAIVPSTGAKTSTVLKHNASKLDQEELKRAVARMQELKFYPRDQLANRHLLHFAERVIAELEPEQRTLLDGYLDDFERALDSGDRELFEARKTQLTELLADLGFPHREPRDQDNRDDPNGDGGPPA